MPVAVPAEARRVAERQSGFMQRFGKAGRLCPLHLAVATSPAAVTTLRVDILC